MATENKDPLVIQIRDLMFRGNRITDILKNLRDQGVDDQVSRQTFKKMNLNYQDVHNAFLPEKYQKVRKDKEGLSLPPVSVLPAPIEGEREYQDTSQLTIYVAISAYQEPHLERTMVSAWNNAKHPERLRFGIVEQSDHSIREQLASTPLGPRTTLIHIKPIDAKGPCWARSIGFSLWNGEDYCAQFDSHMDFDENWDETIIEQIEDAKARVGHSRVLLTTYPNEFHIDESGDAVKGIKYKTPIVLRPKLDAVMKETDATFIFEGLVLDERYTEPVYGHHIAAGCIYADGKLMSEVAYDASLYFLGEEQNFAIRAWTNGWDIIHPVGVPIYHLYKDPSNPDVVHWDDLEDEKRKIKWWEYDQRSKARLSYVLYNNVQRGAFGLGVKRSLFDFAKSSGIDYVNKTITHYYRKN